MVASEVPPTGDLVHNPSMCPDWESNWQPFRSQPGAQSTEPHQPGLMYFKINGMVMFNRQHLKIFLMVRKIAERFIMGIPGATL